MKPEENKIHYDGQESKVLWLYVQNIVLSIITLGIYNFWGRVKMRKYTINCLSIGQERFAYMGTGGELLKGFLILCGAILLAPFSYGIIHYLLYLPPLSLLSPLLLLFNLLSIAGLIFVSYFLQYAFFRYRHSRITWRKIPGKLVGSGFIYAEKGLLYTLLNIISLGILIPKSDMMMYKYRIENTQYGNRKFSFQATSSPPLFRTHIITMLLIPFTFGLSRIWYAAALRRFQWSNTYIGDLQLKATDTGANLFIFYLKNAIILPLTFGLGAAIIRQRSMVYISQHRLIIGNITNLQEVQLGDQPESSSRVGRVDCYFELPL